MRSSRSFQPAAASPPEAVTVEALAADPWLVHCFSTLELGSVHVKGNHSKAGSAARMRLAEMNGLEPESLAVVGAVHGADVARVEEPGAVDDVDGLVTSTSGVGLFATFADCYPVIAYDPHRHVVGLAHAGWRGTVAGVAGNLVATMEREYGCEPSELVAAIGPGVCGRCYEVGDEVAEQFPTQVVERNGEGIAFLDVGRANELQLQSAGVQPERIHRSGLCTKETPWLPSHRRDHDGRRFGAIVALR